MFDLERTLAIAVVFGIVLLVAVFVGVSIEYNIGLDSCILAGWEGTTEIFNKRYCITIDESGTLTGRALRNVMNEKEN